MANVKVRSQPYRIKWPLTPTQVSGADEMFEILFKALRSLTDEVDTLTLNAGGVSNNGKTGAPGDPGEDGQDGVIGPTGPQGPTGATGATGASGSSGSSGAQGPTGPPGDEGDCCTDWLMGPPGPQGSAGSPGAAGPAGSPGIGIPGQDADDDIMDPPWPQLPSNIVNTGGLIINGAQYFPLIATQIINTNLINANSGGGFMPTPISRKNYYGFKDDINGANFSTSVNCQPLLASPGGTLANQTNAAQSAMRATTVSGNNNLTGVQHQNAGNAGMFQHLPEMICKFFTGSAIDHCEIWVGLFDSATASTNPGVSKTGVNTQKHAAIRYCPNSTGAGDTTWVASCADGTTQTTATLSAPATSTLYTFRISFSNSTSPSFQINDMTTAKAISLNTNAADSTPMLFGMYIINDTAVVRFLDFVSLYGSYN